MTDDKRLPHCLFFLRVSIFLVMFMWTIDKLVRPEHAAGVFEKFYFLSGFGGSIMVVIGVLELLFLLCFLSGFKKTVTYGGVLLLHGISTLSSYKQYFSPFEGASLLFFAAWPMLAACYLLYRFREADSMYTISKAA